MSSYEFQSHEPVDLYVELGKGSLNVTATDTTVTTVEVVGRDAEEVMVRQDGKQISVVAPKGNRGLFGGDTSYVVTISLPTHSNAVVKTGSADIGFDGVMGAGQIRSGSGDCRLDTFDGPLIIETGSGDIVLDRAGAELRVKSGSGDVDVSQADNALSVSTGSGDVEIGASSGDTVVKTGSGDLRVGQANRGVAMSTGSGDFVVDQARSGRFVAKGASGDVRIGVPTGVPVWTDISTVSGAIRSSLQGAGEPGEGQDHVEVRATTVTGDIVLTEVS